jgi:pyridoxine 5-phosphate synthase
MPLFSVNINKIALLRNARGGNQPDLLQLAEDLIRFGGQGITVHPRPDERHIRFQDVLELKPLTDRLGVELNVESYPSQRLLTLIRYVQPAQITLVPDAPGALTSNAGWDAIGQEGLLRRVIAEIKQQGCRVSLFMGTDIAQIKAAAQTGADRIELYTGPYAEAFPSEAVLKSYAKAAATAAQLGLGVNAGHDLNAENLPALLSACPAIEEVSIGHALICDALYDGYEKTIQRYLAAIQQGTKGR